MSKQVIGSALVHLANLLLSLLSSGTFTTEPTPTTALGAARLALRRRHAGAEDGGDNGHHSNPCSFYLLNLGIDVCALFNLRSVFCVFLRIPAYSCVFLRISAYSCVFLRIPAYSCVFLRIPAYSCVFLIFLSVLFLPRLIAKLPVHRLR